MTGRIDRSLTKRPFHADAKDRKILASLSENGRAPVTALASQTKLSRDAVTYRIRHLEKAGVLLGVAPVVDLAMFGFGTYHVFLSLDAKNAAGKEELRKHLQGHPHTRALVEHSDTWDLEWTLIARSLHEFDSLLAALIGRFGPLILRQETAAVTKGFSSNNLPLAFYEGVEREILWKQASAPPVLDGKDVSIIEALAKDGRQSTYSLSRKVRVSPDTVGYRIKNLLKAGVIRTFTAVPSLSALGFEVHTLALKMRPLSAQAEVRLAQFCRDHKYILRAVKTFGAYDALITLAVDTPATYHEVVKEIKTRFSDLIETQHTWVWYRELAYEYFPRAVTGHKHSA